MSAVADWLEHHFITCPLKSLTGIDCPGCGMQRSFIALLRGDFVHSLSLYPALLPLLLTFVLLAVHLIFKLKNGAAWLKYSYLSTAGIIAVSYIIKLVNTH